MVLLHYSLYTFTIHYIPFTSLFIIYGMGFLLFSVFSFLLFSVFSLVKLKLSMNSVFFLWLLPCPNPK